MGICVGMSHFFLILCFELCMLFLSPYFCLLLIWDVFLYVFGNFLPAIPLLFYRTSTIYWVCWIYPLYLTFFSLIFYTNICPKSVLHVSSIADSGTVSSAHFSKALGNSTASYPVDTLWHCPVSSGILE